MVIDGVSLTNEHHVGYTGMVGLEGVHPLFVEIDQ
jgi:hypothetical protein